MMKRFIVFALLLALAGCSALRTAADIAGKAEIGMSVREFKRLAGAQAELESLTAHERVYRIDEYDGDTDHRYVSGYKLFYFDRDERLFKIESHDIPGAVIQEIIDVVKEKRPSHRNRPRGNERDRR